MKNESLLNIYLDEIVYSDLNDHSFLFSLIRTILNQFLEWRETPSALNGRITRLVGLYF